MDDGTEIISAQSCRDYLKLQNQNPIADISNTIIHLNRKFPKDRKKNDGSFSESFHFVTKPKDAVDFRLLLQNQVSYRTILKYTVRAIDKESIGRELVEMTRVFSPFPFKISKHSAYQIMHLWKSSHDGKQLVMMRLRERDYLHYHSFTKLGRMFYCHGPDTESIFESYISKEEDERVEMYNILKFIDVERFFRDAVYTTGRDHTRAEAHIRAVNRFRTWMLAYYG